MAECRCRTTPLVIWCAKHAPPDAIPMADFLAEIETPSIWPAVPWYDDKPRHGAGRLYGLAEWAWDQELNDRARWTDHYRPFVGWNPALERTTNG